MKNTRFSTSKKIQNIGLIKKMPPHDPDAEILSLVLTIPSWINSINKVCEQANFKKAGISAKYKLAKELELLKHTAENTIYTIKEKNNE